MSIAATALALVKTIQIPMAVLGLLEQGLWPTHAILKDNAEYDHVIVGGGTAGLIIATRLAQATNCSILVLEAGPDPPVSAILAGLFAFLPGSYVDYNFTSTFDSYAARGQYNHTLITAGRMLGGGASINHLIFTRSSRKFHDDWAQLVGDDSWSYKKILQYYKKLENVQDKDILKANPGYHGTDGPTVLTKDVYKETQNYLKAFAELGTPSVLELNGKESIGYTEPMYIIGKLLRQTPAVTYLPLVKNQLDIATSAQVTKILVENKKAVGVNVVSNSKTYTIKAKKEVIICAGAINSPQLLMLSGIGKADHLNKFNIPVVSDLPVGDNFIDQPAVTLVQKMERSILPKLSIPTPIRVQFPVFIGASALNKSQTYPDYISFNLMLPHDTPYLILLCSVVFGYTDEICDRLNSKVAFRNVLYTLLGLSQPKSRGTVRLASTNPFDKPLITTGYYKENSDLEDMVDYIMDYLKVRNSKYFKKVNVELVGLDLPECSKYKKGTRDFWRCYVPRITVSLYHYSGTCAMGSVVDSKFRVYGISNLRVADSSVIPNVITFAPTATVMMLAEKFAAMMLDEIS